MIEFHDKKNYVRIVINSPASKNALSLNDLKDLQTAFIKVAHESHFRFVVLEGFGTVFCSGADLNDMRNSINKSFDQNLNEARLLHEMFHALWKIPQPILIKAHGAAMGGGLGLVAIADWVVCDEQTRFAFSEVRLGIAPAVISDFILRKFTLSQIASEMITGNIFFSARAEKIGLVHEVVRPEGLEQCLTNKIEELLNFSPSAMVQTKRLTRSLAKINRDSDRMEMVTHLISNLRVGAEGQEGLSAFLEKRAPKWAVGTNK